MANPAMVLAILDFVDAAAIAVCGVIDKALELELEHEARQALKELRKGVESLKSDTMVYKVLLNAMEDDTDLSPYTRFIQRQDGKEAMENLERALKATRLLLEEHPAGNRKEAPMNPSENNKPSRSLHFVLNILKANFRPGHHEFIADIKDATYEIFVCRQNDERAFKLIWNLYVVAQQSTDRCSSVDDTGDIQDRVGQALDFVLQAVRDRPFTVSPEGDSLVPPLAILNRNHENATRHEKLARRIGKAWVDDRVRRDNAQVRDLGTLQTSLFGLLWSGTIEQLKRDSATSDDPERPEFERAVKELETALQGAIIRSKKQRVALAFCGTLKAGKWRFLNALMGRAILPSDESPGTCPCRLRHVEGQKVPKLQFQAEPFLVALQKCHAFLSGQMVQTYQPEDTFEALFSDALPEASEEEILRNTIPRGWIDLDVVTRDDVLKSEKPGFRFPRMTTGEQNVKTLLRQLNNIVRSCQLYNIKFDMSEFDWPLLTVEFNSLRGHRIDGIYELIVLPHIDHRFRVFNFESLVRLVAPDVDAIVPIVSFKELHRSQWKHLPELVASGFNGRANVVVCTHLDQISKENMDEQLKTVTDIFWPRGVLNTNRVIPCSSFMGLSASALLDRSNAAKPPFEAIWDKEFVGYHCAAKFLGTRNPQATYRQLDIQIWKDLLQAEFRASGLPDAIQKLTKEMVGELRINALFSEADTVTRQLRKVSNVYERKLVLERQRIANEYDAVERRCNQAPEISRAVLDTWGRVESMQTQESRLLLDQELEMISKKATRLINQAFRKTLTDRGTSLEDMGVGHGTRGASLGNGDISGKLQESSSAEAGYGNVFITETKSQAKDLLRLCQLELSSLLETLRREYAVIISNLGGTAKAKLLKFLRGMTKQIKLQPLPEDWENCVGRHKPSSLNIDGLAFKEIRGVINSRQLTLFNRQYSIDIDTLHDLFKDEVIDPWIKQMKEAGEKALLGTIETRFKAAKKLMTSALAEREDRYKEELEKKDSLVMEERVECLVAIYGNLLAAEEALRELFVRAEALQARSG